MRKKNILYTIIVSGILLILFFTRYEMNWGNVESQSKLNLVKSQKPKLKKTPSNNDSKVKKKRIVINQQGQADKQTQEEPSLPPFLTDETLRAAYTKRIHKSLRDQFKDFFIENPEIKNKEEVMNIRLSFEDWAIQASIDLLHSSFEEKKKVILQENAKLEIRFQQALGSHYNALKNFKNSLPSRGFVNQFYEKYEKDEKPLDPSLKKELITALVKNQNSTQSQAAANFETLKKLKGRLTGSKLYYIKSFLEQPRPEENGPQYDLW